MSEPQSIQWFPGHMTKTRRRITEQLKAVDAVAEIIDARIPASSRNPDLAGIVVNKPGLILMNKSDISDPAANKIWSDFFRSDGKKVLTVDCRSGKGLGGFVPAVKEILSEKIERNRRRGMPGNDFIDVDELANMIVAASVQEEINGIINVCTGKPMSLADRVEQFLRDKNYKIKLDYGAFPDRPYDSPGTWGDPTKINRILANDTCKRA